MKAMFEKLKNWLAGIPQDKLLHFIAGMVVAAFFSIVIVDTAMFCVVFSGIAGVIKEAVDVWRKPGAWSYSDLLATVLGGLPIQLFVWIA